MEVQNTTVPIKFKQIYTLRELTDKIIHFVKPRTPRFYIKAIRSYQKRMRILNLPLSFLTNNQYFPILFGNYKSYRHSLVNTLNAKDANERVIGVSYFLSNDAWINTLPKENSCNPWRIERVD